MDILGKTVFITGTARGIGQGFAAAFAKAGAKVIGCDLGPQPETAKMVGAGYVELQGDVSTPAGAKALVDQASAIGFDILINNAGVAPSGTFAEVDFETWKKTIDVNVIGLMAVTHAALPHLLGRPEAHIVNMSSIAGAWGSAGVAAYSASKHAVTGFTRSLEYELADTAICVTSIHPSMVKTRMIEGVPAMKTVPVIEPDDVVQAALKAIEKGQNQVFVPGHLRWMLNVLPRILPGLTKRMIISDKDSRGWQIAQKEIPPA